MLTLKIDWVTNAKNCVPFIVFVDGRECGIMKRGETLEVPLAQERAELYFVPKAPRFFGWRALKATVQIQWPAPELHVSVLPDPQLKNMDTCQLRLFRAKGLNVLNSEHVKKY